MSKEKRDRRRAIHWAVGGRPYCLTEATSVPHTTTRHEQVTCKRCLHLVSMSR